MKTIIFTAGFFFSLTACSPQTSNSPQSAEKTSASTATEAQKGADAAKAAAVAAEAAANAAYSGTASTDSSGWNYSHDEDKMGNGVTHIASIISANELNFDFPYNGAQKSRLALRVHPRHGKDVMLSVERGQFDCSFQGCSVMVRFDDNKSEKYSASEPEGNVSDLIFINNYSKFYQNLMKSKRVRIEATFFSQGTRVMEFDTSNFDESKFSQNDG